MCLRSLLRVSTALGRTGLHPNDPAGVEWDIFLEDAQFEAFAQMTAGEDPTGASIRSVVDRMVIAHASTADTVQEAAGVFAKPCSPRGRSPVRGRSGRGLH